MIPQHYARVIEERGLRSGSTLEDIAAYMIIRAGLRDRVEQQYRVCGFRLDFAWPHMKVGLEVDGPTHFSPTSAARDAVRDAELRSNDWLVFHVDGESGNDDLRSQVARVCQVVHALKQPF